MTNIINFGALSHEQELKIKVSKIKENHIGNCYIPKEIAFYKRILFV